ncbi:MAG TPA: response regulator transcription factor, partial [Bacteroidetes bacterium]|nr:response regulator transcription factor [Bacteroidota bacterium]
MQSVNIILADAQQLVRAGFRFLLQEEENLKVVGEAERPKRLQKLLETTQVEVLIFDYHNSDAFSIDDICKIKGAFPDIQILVVTADDNKQNIFSVLECGVSSILTKNCSKEEIINAIEATAKSEKFFCNAVLDILLEKHLGT